MGELGGDEINVNKRPSLMQNVVVYKLGSCNNDLWTYLVDEQMDILYVNVRDLSRDGTAAYTRHALAGQGGAQCGDY